MTDKEQSSSVDYGYDEDAAGHAEDFANRIDTSGMFVGVFKRVWALQSHEKGTHGMHFEFDANGSTANFDLWTMNKEKTEKFFGYNMVQAMQLLLGIKGLKAKKGKIEAYNSETNKREETEGDTFPDLCGKTIGVVLQRENYNKADGKETFRINLLMAFHPESKLTASEIREKKPAAKLERVLRGLKNKDSRTKTAAEPAQPNQSLPSGDY